MLLMMMWPVPNQILLGYLMHRRMPLSSAVALASRMLTILTTLECMINSIVTLIIILDEYVVVFILILFFVLLIVLVDQLRIAVFLLNRSQEVRLVALL